MKKHIALFSQTGTEIFDLYELGHRPDQIIHNHRPQDNMSKPLVEAYFGQMDHIPRSFSKDVKTLRSMLGDPKKCYITLHGWLSIIPKEICDEYEIYNGHPGLITEYPELKGFNPQKRAYEGSYEYVGSIVHRVTADVDEGEVLLGVSVLNTANNLTEMYDDLRKTSLEAWIGFFAQYGTDKVTDNRVFDTGAQRDTGEGKLKMSLVPHDELDRVLKRYTDGAAEYGENNWKKGMPVSELYNSASRHLKSAFQCKIDEDHLAAVCWNVLGMMWTIENKPEMDDRNES